MATYLIAEEIPVRRQAGDDSDLEIIVPEQLPLDNAEIKFKVRNPDGSTLFTKVTADCTIIGQSLTIPFLPLNTRGRAGRHRWELQITDPASYGNVTIGRGDFYIIKEDIEEDN